MAKFVNLSTLDQSLAPIYVSVFFCFAFPDSSNKPAALSCLAASLGRVFAEQPHLSGTVSVARKRIEYNAAILADVTTSGHLVIKDIDHINYDQLSARRFPSSMLPRDTFAPKPHSVSADDEFMRVLLLQANFIQGGLVLSVTYQHNAMDGSSAASVCHKLAAHTRAFSGDLLEDYQPSDPQPDLVPPAILCAPPPSDTTPTIDAPEYDFSNRPIDLGAATATARVLRFDAAKVRELKRQVTEQLARQPGGTPWVSTVDCLSALLWVGVLRSRAARLAADDVVSFSTAVDVRARLGPDLLPPHAFVGYGVLLAMARLPLASFPDRHPPHLHLPLPLSPANVAHAAQAIRRAVRAVDADYVRARVALIGALSDPSVAAVAALRAVDIARTGLFMTSWATFAADAAFDLPGLMPGGPRRADAVCRPSGTAVGAANILPRVRDAEDAADWEILAHLAWDDMGRLLDEDILEATLTCPTSMRSTQACGPPH